MCSDVRKKGLDHTVMAHLLSVDHSSLRNTLMGVLS
jgi:hypothetical protein